MTPPSGGSNWQKVFREVAPYLDLGWRVAVSIVLFTVGGYYLDQWWGTMPWMTVVGAIVGMVMVFVQIFQLNGAFGSGKRSGTPKSGRDRPDSNGA
jgi:F0F1-type ATP synthase assembly protein I